MYLSRFSMSIIRVCRFWLMLILFAGPLSAPAHAADLKAVHDTLDKLVALVLDATAEEVQGTRVVQSVQLESASYFAAVVAVSGMYGGNAGGHYLVLLESSDVEERTKAPGSPAALRLVAFTKVAWKYWRSIEPASLRVDEDRLVLSAKVYGAGDPGCCPSNESFLYYSLINGNLIER